RRRARSGLFLTASPLFASIAKTPQQRAAVPVFAPGCGVGGVRLGTGLLGARHRQRDRNLIRRRRLGLRHERRLSRRLGGGRRLVLLHRRGGGARRGLRGRVWRARRTRGWRRGSRLRCRGVGRQQRRWRLDRPARGRRLGGVLGQGRRTQGASAQPLHSGGERVRHLHAPLLARERGRPPGCQRAGVPGRHRRLARRRLGAASHRAQHRRQAPDERADLAQQALHSAMPLADLRQLAFGALARAPLGVEAALDLLRAAFELGDPRLQLGFGPAQAGSLGGGALFGLGELAAQLLDAPGELSALALAGGDALRELLGALTAVALEPGHAVLGLDAQLLLGVLSLLDPAQLALALGAMRARGLEQLGDAPPFLLGVAKTLLEAGDVAFERLDGGFRGLGTALQCRLAALGRAPRAPFGEEVGLARAGFLALLDHALRPRY